jgi:predicted flap endonuclease-1-like 5' DNA nuclease
VWFLTIESIALLAVATTLGLFAGWLVWGGKPAVSLAKAAPVSSQPSTPATLAEGATATVESKVPDLAALMADDPDGHDEFIMPKVPNTFTSRNSSTTSTTSSTSGGTTGDTWLTPDEIDPGAAKSLAGNQIALETQPSSLESYLSAETARMGDQPTESTVDPEAIRSLEIVAAQLRSEIEQLSAQLETREADVVRLKAKLRKAVEEIEKRTALAQAARAELVDHQQRLAQSVAASAAAESNVAPAGLSALVEHDDFAPVGTRFTSAEIDELIQAKTASLQIQTSQLERRTALIQSRAEEAEARVVALKAEAAQQQAETEAALAKAEREAADRILALEVDLASARQRANLASQELMGFGSEISVIRDTNAKHLQSVHETMRDLQHRLDTTKAALAGRSVSALKPASSPTGADALPSASLMILPGMTTAIVDSLAELGIVSLDDVASWTNEDVDHIQSLLPEDPEIVQRNGWVTAALRLVHEASISSEA